MDKTLLKKYAVFAVNTAVGLQKGQTLIISCPVDVAYFARMCAEEGYAAGAKEVVVQYNDEILSRMKMQNCAVEVLEDVIPYIERMRLDYFESEGGACLLNIISRNPELYKGIDVDKIDRANIALDKAMVNIREYTMNDRVQWSIVAVPSDNWNNKVFPELPPEEATEKMWEAIFTCARVANGDPEGEWADYIERTLAQRFDAIRMTAKNGTDLTVGLADNHIWDGGLSVTGEGYRFIANVPTEEIFTAPHRERVNGKVFGSKPYIYNGDIIDDYYFVFKDGKVVEHGAKTGGHLLEKMLTVDENACRIGEIALVDNNSGVGKSGLLYFNTLYDENAACHIAFGRAYPTNVQDGDKLSKEELNKLGVNYSLIHEDMMIGTSDMNIVGIRPDGTEMELFKDGFWVV